MAFQAATCTHDTQVECCTAAGVLVFFVPFSSSPSISSSAFAQERKDAEVRDG